MHVHIPPALQAQQAIRTMSNEAQDPDRVLQDELQAEENGKAQEKSRRGKGKGKGRGRGRGKKPVEPPKNASENAMEVDKQDEVADAGVIASENHEDHF